MTMNAPLFAEFSAIDARFVRSLMLSDVVLRLRAQDRPGAHPLLPMRLSRLEGVRARMRTIANQFVDNYVPGSFSSGKWEIEFIRAQAMMMRVLECSDAPEVKARVQEDADAIGVSINFMARALQMEKHREAIIFTHYADVIREFAGNVDAEAQRMRQAYEAMVIKKGAPDPAPEKISNPDPENFQGPRSS